MRPFSRLQMAMSAGVGTSYRLHRRRSTIASVIPPAPATVQRIVSVADCAITMTEACANETASGGGNGYFSVYLDGLKENVGSDSSPSNTNTNTHTVTSASPSVVTQVSPGKTVVETVHAESTNSADSSSGGGGGVNSTAVAAGVVVAVVVISAIIAGLLFWCRHRKRQVVEEEYKRTQVSDFIHGSKPPQTGYSSMSDSRLDPEFGNKRNSHGSIADNEDFSRKILRVS